MYELRCEDCGKKFKWKTAIKKYCFLCEKERIRLNCQVGYQVSKRRERYAKAEKTAGTALSRIAAINKIAREKGMSYGEYQGYLYQGGGKK